MTLLPKDEFGCPTLQLAPMEGVGDASFRKAIASIGGFDEAVRDFLRVPKNAHVKSLAKVYDPHELSPIPLAAQLMGSDPDLMAEMAQEIERRGAPRIDINCGCPSNTVTGRGAGSSLLKEPNVLHEVAKAVVQAVSIPVSLKMRIGFEDTSLFQENVLAAESAGVCYITLHPRTKVDGYGPPARWEYIAAAKQLLKIPLVGNGDIVTVPDALRMLEQTGCDALMIGRGSLMNPFLFHEIRAHFAGRTYTPPADGVRHYFETFLAALPEELPVRQRINKLKQLLSFLLKKEPERRQAVLTASFESPEAFLAFALDLTFF